MRLSSFVRPTVGVGLGVIALAAVLTVALLPEPDTGRQVARDHAYNLLMSVAEDSVLFTYGDNDTYPLWYLQNVEGVRPDVRVVNLSLLGTTWYIRQVTQESAHGAPPIPSSLTDQRIETLRYQRRAPTVRLPVDSARVMAQPDVNVPAEKRSQLSSPMTWTIEGSPNPYGQGSVLSVTDQVVYNTLKTAAENGWDRPIYFATSVPSDYRINLEPYLQLEGLAHRVLPVRYDRPRGRVDPEVTPKRIAQFRLDRFVQHNAHFGSTERGVLDDYYRSSMAYVAEALARQGRAPRGRQMLDRLTTHLPFTTVAGTLRSFTSVAQAYQTVGVPEQAVDVARMATPHLTQQIVQAQSRQDLRAVLPYVQPLRSVYQQAGASAAQQDFDANVRRAIERQTRLPPDFADRLLGSATG